MATDRDDELLQAAAQVFLRFGYRKASMDEIARHAGMSRQGVYLHHRSKQALFVAAVQFMLDGALARARAALAAADPIEARLVAACDAVHGEFIDHGGDGTQLAELAATSKRLVGPLLERFSADFLAALTAAIDAAGIADRWDQPAVSAADLARTLEATSVGLKHTTATRAAWRSRLRTAVHIYCRSPR